MSQNILKISKISNENEIKQKQKLIIIILKTLKKKEIFLGLMKKTKIV